MLRFHAPVAAVVIWSALGTQALGAVLHNETVNGDLSNDRTMPTTFTLTPGSNTIGATSVSGDREFVRLDIPAGMQMTQIVLDAYTTGSNLSFIGVNPGTSMIDPATATPAMLMGYTHFGVAQIGTDILPAIGTGAGSPGFIPPLTSGSYTFWIQETSTLPSSYTLNFVVAPAPGVGMAGLVGLAMLGSRRRR